MPSTSSGRHWGLTVSIDSLGRDLERLFEEGAEAITLQELRQRSDGSVTPSRPTRPFVVAAVVFVAVLAVGVGTWWIAGQSPTADTSPPTATTVPTTAPTSSSLPEGEMRVWDGMWSNVDSTFGSSEILPRVFVLDDQVLIVHEQNLGTTVEGEIYDPNTGEATRIASSGLVWRANAAMVWTGDELLVVGGANGPGIEQVGAAYSPSTDSWRALPEPPVPVDAFENAVTGPAVWSGTEMVIPSEGLSFNPTTGQWATIPTLPGPTRHTEVVVWTGSEVVVWGGCDATEPQCDDFATGLLTDGYAYDPDSEQWRPVAASPLSAGVHPQGAWTGEELIIYAGAVTEEDGVTAAAYNPTTDSWRVLPNPPLTPRRYAAAAWTGEYVVLWGGSGIGTGAEVEYDDGTAYNPDTNIWLEIPQTPGFDERDRHAMVWVQDELYITGGFETTGPLTFTPSN